LARLRRLFSTSAVILAGSSGVAVLSLLQSAVIARSLGVADFGLWSLTVTTFSVVTAFVGFRVAEPLTRYIVEFKVQNETGALQRLFGAAVTMEALTLCSAALVGVGASMALGGAFTAAGRWVLAVYALSLPCAALHPILFAAARDARRVGLHSAVSLALELVRLVLLVTAWMSDRMSLHAVAWTWLGTAAVQLFASAILLDRLMRNQLGFGLTGISLDVKASCLRGFWRFMRRNFAASSVSAILKNADLLILGMLQAPAAVGTFRVAKSIAALLQMVTAPIGLAFYQDANELLLDGNRRAAYQLIRRATIFATPFILFAALFTGVFASDIIALIYGPEYRPAAPLLAVLLVSSSALSILFWAQPAVLALDRTRFYFRSLFGATLIALPCYWLASSVGPLPLALAVTLIWTALPAMIAMRVRTELIGVAGTAVRHHSAPDSGKNS